MIAFKTTLATLLSDESGQDLVEYALVASLIGVGSVASMKGVANAVKTVFTSVSTTLSTNV